MNAEAICNCNAALAKLGVTVDGLDEARRLYPHVRDTLLTAHPWTFTVAKVALNAPTRMTGRDYSFAFALPGDFLRVILADGEGYRVHGDRLLADVPWLTLTYQRRTDEFPAFFMAALVARLAAELCLPLTDDSVRASALHDVAVAELRLARLLNERARCPA